MKSSFALAYTAMILSLASGVLAADQRMPAASARPSPAEVAHARALDSFRRARFPEAYGRFVQLANNGHAPSARIALWMCEQGPTVFGSDWDCTPDEVEDWRALTRVATLCTTCTSSLPAASRQGNRGAIAR
jgi:hypothetical protein